MITAVIVDNNHDINNAIANHYKFLPKDTLFKHINEPSIKSREDYSKLFMEVSFWKQFNTEDILVFQHDSVLLREGIEEFLKYDYIGASFHNWFPFNYMNGGLSLRKKSAMIDVIENHKEHLDTPEDFYFCQGLLKLNKYLPDPDVCDRFSIESHFKLGSMGFHAIDTYLTPLQCTLIRNQYL